MPWLASVEEALFFHTIARNQQVAFEIKGENPQPSIIRSSVLKSCRMPQENRSGKITRNFLTLVQDYEAVIIAGQARAIVLPGRWKIY
jgi:hypothetical protein